MPRVRCGSPRSPDLLPPTTSPEPPRDELHLLQEARVALEQESRRRTLVLVDDAHLLDPGSAALLLQVATSSAATLLITLETSETAPDPITALWRDDVADRLDLAPLDRTETVHLVEQALGGPLEPAAHRELWGLSRGNVLFLTELVEGAVERGALTRRGGAWVQVGRFAPSGRLIEVVEGRLSELTADERTLLEVLALMGGLTPLSAEELAGSEAVTSMERRRLVRWEQPPGGDDVLRLAHPVHGEVLRDLTPRSRTRQLARALSRTKDEGVPHGDVVGRAALLLASDESPPVPVLVEAAREALSRFDLATADRLSAAALHHQDRFEPRLVRGQVLSALGLGDHAAAGARPRRRAGWLRSRASPGGAGPSPEPAARLRPAGRGNRHAASRLGVDRRPRLARRDRRPPGLLRHPRRRRRGSCGERRPRAGARWSRSGRGCTPWWCRPWRWPSAVDCARPPSTSRPPSGSSPISGLPRWRATCSASTG